MSAASPVPTAGSGVTNTQALGEILYTKYVYFFQGAGLILLVAMIGAIVLTLKHRPKRQTAVDRRPSGARAEDRPCNHQGSERRQRHSGGGRPNPGGRGVNGVFELIEPYGRYWPYGVALLAGAVLAIVDRKVFGRYVLAWLLMLIAIAGAIGMNVSPFTFQGDDHYFQSLIAMLFALAGLQVMCWRHS